MRKSIGKIGILAAAIATGAAIPLAGAALTITPSGRVAVCVALPSSGQKG